ncbi:MAG: LD-carboxypeptidase [Desulfotomaculaceae bacterium]|nr:LD-carboxypeptidase [Desulfotomaculaceae bacterium]MDD4766778.1 LD-carboxypeptidase [Desulfotomaculaceae bacterium]
MIRKPAALGPGATLGIIAPASPARDLDPLTEGIKMIEELGFKVSLSPNVLGCNKYLAGSESERLADFHEMFLDPAIDGIICLRGGYGSMQLLPGINYRAVRHNPKLFVGYSDITALQLALWKKARLVTFSGPMLTSDLGNNPSDFTLKHFYRAVTDPHPLGAVPCAPGVKTTVLVPGCSRGRLLGGNLTMIAATLGTPYEIDTRGTILLLEDVDEQPYRVDRMLQQLRLAGKFDRASGVVFGEFVNCEADDQSSSLTLLEVIEAAVAGLNVPCFHGLSAGHGVHKATLPLGVQAKIDTDECLLKIIEPATTPASR